MLEKKKERHFPVQQDRVTPQQQETVIHDGSFLKTYKHINLPDRIYLKSSAGQFFSHNFGLLNSQDAT